MCISMLDMIWQVQPDRRYPDRKLNLLADHTSEVFVKLLRDASIHLLCFCLVKTARAILKNQNMWS